MSAIDRAARYLSEADDDQDDDEFEERLFDDPEAARAAAWLLELHGALRELAGLGPLVPVVTPGELAALASSGVRLFECRPTAGVIDTAVPASCVFIAARLPVVLDGVRSIDVAFCAPSGEAYFAVREAPCDRASNEVVVLCERHVALAAGSILVIVRDDLGAKRGVFSLLSKDVV